MWFFYLLLIAGGAYAIYYIYNKVKEQQKRKKELIDITLSKEPKIELSNEYIQDSFSCEEEKILIDAINKKISFDNALLIIENKISHRKKIKSAFLELGNQEEASKTEMEIDSLSKNCKTVKEASIDYKWHKFNFKTDKINFPPLNLVFPKLKRESIHDISPKTFITYSNHSIKYYFTTLCIIKDNGYNISFLRYKDCKINVSHFIETTTTKKDDDEVIRKYWLFEKKDGSPDYRYANNKLFYRIKKYKVVFVLPDSTEYEIQVNNSFSVNELEAKYNFLIDFYKVHNSLITDLLKCDAIGKYNFDKYLSRPSSANKPFFDFDTLEKELKVLKNFQIEDNIIKGYKGQDDVVVLPNIKYANKLSKECFMYAKIKEIIIPKGYEEIPEKAFAYSKIIKVTLPSSVTKICNSAFRSCKELTEINLENVEYFGEDAFAYCECVENVDLSSATTIENGALYLPKKIKNVYIGQNIKYIDKNAFFTCSEILKLSINCSKISYNLFECFNGIAIKHLIIGNDAIEIEPNIFKKIEHIEIGKSLQRIPSRSFIIDYTEKITIKNQKCIIENEAFCSIYRYSLPLKKISFPNGIRKIPNNFLKNCSSLEIVDLSKGIEEIGDYAFANCKALNTIILPDNIERIGIGAFYNCESLQSVNLGNNIVVIDNLTFSNCKKLKEIILPEKLFRIGEKAFENCVSLSTINSRRIDKIQNYAFSNCNKLKELITTEQINYIGKFAFYNCKSLEKIVSKGIDKIDDFALSDCSKLTDVLLSDAITQIGDNSFRNCKNLSAINLSLKTQVGRNSFAGCKKLETIPNFKLTSEMIKNLSFTDTKFLANNVPNGFAIAEDTLYEYAGKEEKVIIPNNVSIIETHAFVNNDKIKNVIVLENVKNIREYAFTNCKNLEYVNVVSKKTYVSKKAFESCPNLVKGNIQQPPININVDKPATVIKEKEVAKPVIAKTVVDTNKSSNKFNKGDLVEHNSFGKGEIIKITEDHYHIKFDELTNNKIISKKYKDLKPYCTKYVYHNNYLYGKLIKEELNNYIVLFDSGEQKTISKLYKGISLISEKEYLNKSSSNGNVDLEPKEQDNTIHLYDVVKHSLYGKGIVISINNELCDIVFTSTKKMSFFLNSDKLMIVDNYKSKVKSLTSLTNLNYIYCEGKGYGIICLVGNTHIHVLWKTPNTVEIVNKEIVLISNIIKKDNHKEIINLNKFNVVGHKTYGYGYVENFLDNLIGVRFLNYPTEIKWLKIDEISIPSKEELQDNCGNEELLFIDELTSSCYAIDDAREIYNSYYKSKGHVQEITRKFSKYGYKLFENNYLIKSETGDMELCLINEFVNKQIYRYDYGLESNSYNYALKKLLSSYYCVEYQEGIYFTFSKFASLGIKLKDFEDLNNNLVNYVKNNKFVTLDQIKNNVKSIIFEKIINTYALEKLISLNENIRYRKIGGIIIYQIKDTGKRADAIEELLILSLKNNKEECMNVYDLVDYLNEKYEFEFDFYSFVNLLKELKDSSLYYSEETEKLYLNKKIFIKEVFGDGIKNSN